MVNVSRKDLERLAIGFGIADFLTEGRLSAPVARGTKSALKKAAPAIARGIIKWGPRAAVSAARVTPGPVAAAAAGATLYANRERIRDAAGNVYERVQPGVSEYLGGVRERIMDPETYAPLLEGPTIRPVVPAPFLAAKSAVRRKKKVSKFNKAVKAGMTTVRGSTSYGKKGVINNARKAFSAVTKIASKVKRGKKVGKTGITGRIARAVRRIL